MIIKNREDWIACSRPSVFKEFSRSIEKMIKLYFGVDTKFRKIHLGLFFDMIIPYVELIIKCGAFIIYMYMKIIILFRILSIDDNTI